MKYIDNSKENTTDFKNTLNNIPISHHLYESFNLDFHTLENYQIHTIVKGFQRLSEFNHILKGSGTLQEKQIKIEALDFITSKDLAFDLQESESEFLTLIDITLNPPLVNYWTPKHISMLCQGKSY
jgi:hypothetical protein